MKKIVAVIVLVAGAPLMQTIYERSIYSPTTPAALNGKASTLILGKERLPQPQSALPIENFSPNTPDPQDIFFRRAGIVHRSINSLTYDSDLMSQLRRDLENFHRYGSIGAGRPTTEFSNTSDLKKSLATKGLDNLLNGLAFVPIQLAENPTMRLELMGADDQGKHISKLGWNGFYQTATDPTGRQVELSEVQLETKLGDGVEILTEYLNASVGEYKASTQSMKDDAGNYIYSIQWGAEDRLFTLNTRSLSLLEALSIANWINQQYTQLPHLGWKKDYVLDENNPLHRLAEKRLTIDEEKPSIK